MDEYLTEQFNIYKDKLENYIYINHDNLHILKSGGKIKYIDLNGNLKYGGILIKMVDTDMYTTLKFLLKIQSIFYTISYTKNYIFFEPPEESKKNKRKMYTELLTEFSKK